MRAIFDNEEESLFSKESSGINTNISLAKRMKTKSTKVTSDSVDPQVYKLSVSEKLASKLGRKCTLLTGKLLFRTYLLASQCVDD